MKKRFYILSILSLLVAFNVNAKDAKKDPQVDGYRIKFKEIDKDGKGYITEKVYIKYHDKQWKLIDSMKEDFISKDEFIQLIKCTLGNFQDIIRIKFGKIIIKFQAFNCVYNIS